MVLPVFGPLYTTAQSIEQTNPQGIMGNYDMEQHKQMFGPGDIEGLHGVTQAPMGGGGVNGPSAGGGGVSSDAYNSMIASNRSAMAASQQAARLS